MGKQAQQTEEQIRAAVLWETFFKLQGKTLSGKLSADENKKLNQVSSALNALGEMDDC